VIGIINKPLLLHLVGVYIICTIIFSTKAIYFDFISYLFTAMALRIAVVTSAAAAQSSRATRYISHTFQ